MSEQLHAGGESLKIGLGLTGILVVVLGVLLVLFGGTIFIEIFGGISILIGTILIATAGIMGRLQSLERGLRAVCITLENVAGKKGPSGE